MRRADIAANESDERLLLRTVGELQADLGDRTAPVTLDADLEQDLGFGSLERVELLARLERVFSVRLPDDAVSEAHTARSLLERLSAAANGRSVGGARHDGVGRAPAPEPGTQLSESATLPAWVQTMVDVARHRADVDGERPHLRLLGDGGADEVVSFRELWQDALRVGGGLASLGLEPGDRVAIVLPTCRDFFTTFLGVLCAAGVPVPIYPPVRLDQLQAYVDRHAAVLRNAGPRVIVTDQQLLRVGGLLGDRVPSVTDVVPAASLRDSSVPFLARVSTEDLALIQYTSGSTGDPKGVALRHRDIFANVVAAGRALEVKPTDSAVSWLPLYHDMGLMGLWMTPLLYGRPVAVLSPLQFLVRPERWLWGMHRFRATISAAPNFAYELCARRIRDEDIEGLDLSSWRCALNGAEPIRAETLERFCARFAPYGFRRETMMPVFGLAETTLALTFPPHDRAPRYDRVARDVFVGTQRAQPAAPRQRKNLLTFVSCGRPLEGYEVRIADPADPRGPSLPERHEGRILFRGPSTMKEYFGRPDATAAVRYGDWVDTGDLGYLADGELYVSGRVKDLLIKGGRKYHPHDIEQAAQTVEGIRKGNVIAVGAPDDRAGEVIVVIAETREPSARHEELARAVTAAVQAAVGAPADRVVLVPPGTIPKTSSGKLRRRETLARYLRGQLVSVQPGVVRQMIVLGSGSVPRRLAALGTRAAQVAYGLYAIASGGPVMLLGLGATAALGRTEATAWAISRAALRIAAGIAGLSPQRLGAPLPQSGVIAVSNHASNLDALVLMLALEHPVVFTVKAPVFAMPVVGRALRQLGHIPIWRTTGGGNLQGYRAADEAIRAGRLLHFFPEATFTPATGVRSFRLGAFALAAKHGLPIVPIAIRGTRKVLRDGQSLPRPGRIEVEVLPAFAPPAAEDFRGVARLRDEVREVLARAVGEPLLLLSSAGLPPGSQPDPEPSGGWGGREDRHAAPS